MASFTDGSIIKDTLARLAYAAVLTFGAPHASVNGYAPPCRAHYSLGTKAFRNAFDRWFVVDVTQNFSLEQPNVFRLFTQTPLALNDTRPTHQTSNGYEMSAKFIAQAMCDMPLEVVAPIAKGAFMLQTDPRRCATHPC